MGTQLLASRPDNMEFAMQATTDLEWKSGHIWDILLPSSPTAFGLGISAHPPCFRVLFGKVQQCSILRDPTDYRDLKSHHLQAGSQLYLSPPLFFQQYMKKSLFFLCVVKGTHGLFGGGGARAPQPHPLHWVRHC